MIKWVLLIVAALLVPAAAHAEGNINGYMMGDAFWNAGHHVKEFKGITGFQFRRVYLTYDNDLGGNAFSMRLRLEMAHADQNNANGSMVPFVKDAYLAYKNGDHKGYFGISGTPTFGLEEAIWGYRAVEKTPVDLQGWRSSRDTGIKVKGKFGMIGYQAMVGNGESKNQENNKNKAFYLALNVKPVEGLIVEAYGDYYNNRAIDSADALTQVGAGHPASNVIRTSDYLFRLFAAYKGDWGRVGASASHRVVEQGSNETAVAPQVIKPDAHMNLFSVFAVAKVTDKVAAFARADYIDYPMAKKPTYFNSEVSRARPLFMVFGVDYEASKNVHIIPNIEIMAYGKSIAAEGTNSRVTGAGQGPRSIVIPRVTFYWKFK